MAWEVKHHAASADRPSHCRTRASGSAFWVTSLTTAMESAPAAKISAACSNFMPPIATSGMSPTRFFHSVIFGMPCGSKRIGPIPLVAIGGIKFEHAAEIFAAGADSIAVVSDVTQNADPDARVRQWLGLSKEAA